jgi:hypothetical protein
VTASEFVFLALGLVLGIAAGAALVEILRARPPAPREVRVTVAADVVPRRRSATLADDGFAGFGAAEPARGGPADRRGDGSPVASGVMDRRTPVRSGPEISGASGASGVMSSQTLAAMIGTEGVGEGRSEQRRPLPISGGADPTLTAFRASAAANAATALRTQTATALLDAPTGSADDVASSAPSAPSAPDGSAAPGTPPAPTGPCAESRRLADERCELALRARVQAAAADEAHRAAQRAYDEHEAAAETAAAAADPRAVRRAKDEAQARFRDGRATATTSEAVEAAARAWLLDINAINAEAREAANALSRERAAATAIAVTLERGAVEADAARIAAEMAESACLAAREALAACEEAEAGGVVGHMPAMPSQAPPWESTGDDDDPLAVALGGGGNPRIFRLVRGDRAALNEIVAALAGEDPEDRRHWQLAFSNLVDAILADSIAAGSLAFPLEHPFWGAFTLEQDREIAAALSSLGYRFDGLGGWVDGRTPSQRDLSLALGYAGLDPMRIRHWPTEDEMAELFRDVQVAAAEHLAASAGELTLGELVSMLGRRADGLAEVWNHWGRIRPLLLEES